MKVPADALIEWRCLGCSKPFGYVRKVRGVITFSTLELSFDEGGRFVLRERALTRELLESATPPSRASAHPDDGLVVCCGRHYGLVTGDDLKPSGIRKRKVMVKPTDITQWRTAPPGASRHPSRSAARLAVQRRPR